MNKDYIEKQPVKIIDSGAKFSDDKKYRYTLWRVWDESLPRVQLIGLNPSTANESTNDATIRRLISLISFMTYGGFYMTNLFAFVTPYPKVLQECSDPLGNNDEWLIRTRESSKDVIFCWGSFKVLGRDKQVIKMFPDAYCFAQNKDGAPKHPLYLKRGSLLGKFNPQ